MVNSQIVQDALVPSDPQPGTPRLVGRFRPVHSPELIEPAIRALRQRTGETTPYTLPELRELIARGTLLPSLEDFKAPPHDPIFSAPNKTLEKAFSLIDPSDVRRVRHHALYKKAREYEKEVIAHLRPLTGNASPHRLHYATYLSRFHNTEMRALIRPWVLPIYASDSKAHTYIQAGSGQGKSSLLKVLMYNNLRRNEGVILIDPHGDLAMQVARWKEFRPGGKAHGKLVYFDPYLAGGVNTPVINPLSPLYGSKYLNSAISMFLSCLSAVVGDMEVSKRMTVILKPCLYVLARKKGATLYDLLNMLREKDNGYFKAEAKNLTNQITKDFIEEDFSEDTYNVTKQALIDRFQILLGTDECYRCLVGTNTIDLRKEMDRGAFIIFNLADGRMGDQSEALGKFLLAAIHATAMGRADIPEHDRKSVYCYIDESDRYINKSIEDMYKQTRKYGLHLTLAQQIAGASMSTEQFRSIIGNSAVRIAGNSGDDTSIRKMAASTGAEVEDIKTLKKFNFVFRSGSSAIIRAKIPNLLEKKRRHSMKREEWAIVRKEQIKNYYSGSHPQAPCDEIPSEDARLPGKLHLVDDY